MKTETDEFYIVGAVSVEVLHDDGSIMSPAGKMLWLGVEDGYYQLYSIQGFAKRFETIPTQEKCMEWQGKPWYNRFDPSSLIVYKVTKIRSEAITTAKVYG